MNYFSRIAREYLTAQPANLPEKKECLSREGPLLATTIRQMAQPSCIDAVVTRSGGESRRFAAFPADNSCPYLADGALALANKPPYLSESIGAVETTSGRRL